MVCLTPVVSTDSSRKRRSTDTLNQSIKGRHIVRRQTSNQVEGKFYFGVVLDGLNNFRNLSEITVFKGPHYSKFTEDKHEKGVSDNQTILIIKVCEKTG